MSMRDDNNKAYPLRVTVRMNGMIRAWHIMDAQECVVVAILFALFSLPTRTLCEFSHPWGLNHSFKIAVASWAPSQLLLSPDLYLSVLLNPHLSGLDLPGKPHVSPQLPSCWKRVKGHL